MKYEVKWMSPRQGLQSTQVDALNVFAAQEQVESMYAHIDGYRYISTSPVFNTQRDVQSSNSSPSNNGGGSDDDLSTVIAGVGVTAGFFIALLGLFFLPLGIIAFIVGGLVGWLSWKLAGWLSDRGW